LLLSCESSRLLEQESWHDFKEEIIRLAAVLGLILHGCTL
jgi:hypothetical protein